MPTLPKRFVQPLKIFEMKFGQVSTPVQSILLLTSPSHLRLLLAPTLLRERE
jgi:hypothetical protein